MTVIPGFGQIAQAGLSRIGDKLQQFAAQKFAFDLQEQEMKDKKAALKKMEEAIKTLGPTIGALLAPNAANSRAPQPTGEEGPLGIRKVTQPTAPEDPTPQAAIGEAALRTGVNVGEVSRLQAIGRLPPEIQTRILANLSEMSPEKQLEITTNAELRLIEQRFQNQVSALTTGEAAKLASRALVPLEVAKGVIDGTIPLDDPRAQRIRENQTLMEEVTRVQIELDKARTGLLRAQAEEVRRETAAGGATGSRAPSQLTQNFIGASQDDQLALGVPPSTIVRFNNKPRLEAANRGEPDPELAAYRAEIQRVTSVRELGSVAMKEFDEIESAVGRVATLTNAALRLEERAEQKESFESAAAVWNTSVGSRLNNFFEGKTVNGQVLPPIFAEGGRRSLEYFVRTEDAAGNASEQKSDAEQVALRQQLMQSAARRQTLEQFNQDNVPETSTSEPPPLAVPDVEEPISVAGVSAEAIAGIAAEAKANGTTVAEVISDLNLGASFTADELTQITAAAEQAASLLPASEPDFIVRGNALLEATPDTEETIAIVIEQIDALSAEIRPEPPTRAIGFSTGGEKVSFLRALTQKKNELINIAAELESARLRKPVTDRGGS